MAEHIARPRIVVIRGSGDAERLEEIAQRQLRLARCFEDEEQRRAPELTVQQIADLRDRARRGRAEFERIQRALQAYQKSTPSNPVSIDLQDGYVRP